jgi:hypothetical protein
MLLALGMIRSRNGGRSVPCYTHPNMFRTRALKLPNGSVRPMEDIPSRELGAELVVTQSRRRCSTTCSSSAAKSRA